MEILNEKSNFPTNVSLILGFFDGIHAGHNDVIKNTSSAEKVVVTFSKSPAEYFSNKFEYIYPRRYNYELLAELGVKYVYEQDFASIVNLSASEYLDFIIKKFQPKSITTGFNHTFGTNRSGNPEFLLQNQNNFEYLCTPATKIGDKIVCSTLIKDFISKGDLNNVKSFLSRNFSIESTVIKGEKLGRKLGFPTANMKYPEQIVKLPYGVYKVKVLDRPAILNWGVKPTFASEPLLEVHIPNYNEDLYGKVLRVEIFEKIRDERKFLNIDDLKNQIEKDVQKCLEL